MFTKIVVNTDEAEVMGLDVNTALRKTNDDLSNKSESVKTSVAFWHL